MGDNFEHNKPYSLTATYQENPAPTELTAPYDLHATYDENYAANSIDFILDTEFSFEVVAVFEENTDAIGQIDSVLDTNFSFEIVAEFAENLCTIDTVLDTAFQFQIDAVFDINHIVGVSYAFDASYQKAIAALSVAAIPWAKPILRVSNDALFYD